ncbi:RNA polymerase sigma-70 factor (ECF subfamily) [Melghirimyces profundicolus]|uniref:RNA polymerase sigma-70 factor (ECF subfamily) n=1 Tax=Melghirimyces profundicolus TaxID=1242148 RepID=A0A2T6C958_9BACL|nr:RNA polymerase sigma-70 factor (ECF subfamily) [Melghirimyces profundicolus]
MIDGDEVRRAREGDREALVRLLRKLEGPVYRTARYMLGDEQDAMDAAQEALVRIYRNLSGYRMEAKVETWAQRIALRTSIDFLRKRKPTLPLEEGWEPHRVGKGSPVEWSGVAFDVQEAILRLPEPQRTAVILRYQQDFTYEEVAETMEMPLNTVKSHLFRGRKKLQSWLADYQEGGVLP